MLPHPLSDSLALLIAQRFRVLAEPTRIRLLDRLRDGEASVQELTETLETSQQNVSKHLGVLAQVAGCFAERGISISTVRQAGAGNDATLVIVTHCAPEESLQHTVQALGALDSVRKVNSVMRVVSEVRSG